MNVILECGNEAVTIWFGEIIYDAPAVPVTELPDCGLVFQESRALHGIRFGPNASRQCPYELSRLARIHTGEHLMAVLPSTYDRSCDMGYIYLDTRGPGAIKRSIDCGVIVLDIHDGGTVIGLEVFSPSETMPQLVASNKNQ